MSDPIPVVLERRVVTKPWGGTALGERLGLDAPDGGEPIGETWELYDRADGSSEIRGGGGETLRDLMQRDMDAVLGRGVWPAEGGYFPLLIKFIDAAQRLSVQVHPAAQQARELGDGPKNEAWIVLDTADDARIIRGFREGVTTADVEAAFDSPAIEPLLLEHEPKPWDAFRIDAGVVHAIGPGVVVYEVQQNSDLTFRMYDWGRGRELHLDAARRAMTLDGGGAAKATPERVDDSCTWLLREKYFQVRRLCVTERATLGTEGTFKIGTVLDGHAALGWRSGGQHPPLPLRTGDTFLVPACVDSIYVSPIGNLELLWTGPGEGS